MIVALGGLWLATTGAPASAMFTLVGVAMTIYGVASAFAVWVTRWQR